MKRFEGLVATSLATATLVVAGCGSHNESSPQVTHPDITQSGCDLEQSRLKIYESLIRHEPLTVYSLADLKNKQQDIITGYEGGSGPEIVNPLVLVCNGAIKSLIGIDRGFAGTDRATPMIFPANNATTYDKVKWGNTPKTTSIKDMSKYLVKVTVTDPGPSPEGGARGLVSAGKGFGVMP